MFNGNVFKLKGFQLLGVVIIGIALSILASAGTALTLPVMVYNEIVPGYLYSLEIYNDKYTDQSITVKGMLTFSKNQIAADVAISEAQYGILREAPKLPSPREFRCSGNSVPKAWAGGEYI